MLSRHDAVTKCYQIPGNCWPSELNALWELFKNSKRHVEIGSYCGRSLFITAMAMPLGAELISVDNLKSSYGGPGVDWDSRVLAVTCDAIRAYRPDLILKIVNSDSLMAAANLAGSVESVYIDASHYYADVLADIGAWLPKVSSGGVIAGHDYWTADVGVMDAVNESFGEFLVVPKTRIWVKSIPLR